MSAFIVSTETMHRVVDAIDKHHQGFFGNLNTTNCADLDAIGNSLFQMNASAVNYRYWQDIQEPPPYFYRPMGDVPMTDQFMAIECLLYQCSEGNVPERAMYKALERVRDRLAISIAHEAARAAGAQWDWPER